MARGIGIMLLTFFYNQPVIFYFNFKMLPF